MPPDRDPLKNGHLRQKGRCFREKYGVPCEMVHVTRQMVHVPFRRGQRICRAVLVPCGKVQRIRGPVHVPHRRFVVPRGSSAVPRQRFVVPEEKFVVPQERFAVPRPTRAVPGKRFIAPPEKSLVPGKKGRRENSPALQGWVRSPPPRTSPGGTKEPG